MSQTRKEWLQETDKGLSYEEALHGVQTAIGQFYHRAMEPKHMRTGVDASKADMLALTCLLIDKGVFTIEEYEEYCRLAMNAEVAMREKEISAKTGLGVSFR